MQRIAALVLLLVGAGACAAEPALVPFGAAVADAVPHYDRLTPSIAGGGAVEAGGYRILAQAGIRTVVDLRTSREGVAQAREQAQAAGLRYFNLAVDAAPPSRDVLERFAELMADPNLQPLYFHCRSGVRAGTLWAIYRRSQGVATDQAILEGRTIGLSDARIPQVRDYPLSPP